MTKKTISTMQIFIHRNGQRLRPFDEKTVRQMMQNGQLSPNDLGIKQGQQNWHKLGELFPASSPIPNHSAVKTPIQLNNPSVNQTPKSGSKKALLFGLLGCGGIILLSFIALFLLGLIGKFSAPTNATANSNSTKPIVHNTPISYAAIMDKAKELSVLSPPVKLDSAAKIKGKIAIVDTYLSLAPKMEGYDSEAGSHGIIRERLAKTPDEIDTLIQRTCVKGRKIGDYVISGSKGIVTAFANDCTISIIDYKKKVVFARKTFSNSVAKDTIKLRQKTGETIVEAPDGAFDYISDFPKEPFNFEKTITDASMLPDISDLSFADSALKLAKLRFPQKIDPNARFQGKITIVQAGESDFEDNYGGWMVGLDKNGKFEPPLPNSINLTRESVGLTNEQLATKQSEIGTLVQVICKPGSVIKKVNGIVVSSQICRVSIIDYKGLATIAEKTFENKTIDNNRYSDPSIYEDKKDTVSFPRAEIEEYIKQFPKS